MLLKRLGTDHDTVQVLNHLYAEGFPEGSMNHGFTMKAGDTLYIFSSDQLEVLVQIKEAAARLYEAAERKPRCLKCLKRTLDSSLAKHLKVLASICVKGKPPTGTCKKCSLTEEAEELFDYHLLQYARLIASEDVLIKAFFKVLKPSVIQAVHAEVLRSSKAVRRFEVWPFKILLLSGEDLNAYMCHLGMKHELWLLVDALASKILEEEERKESLGCSLEEILDSRQEIALEVLGKLNGGVGELTRNSQQLGKLAAFRSCGLDELYPLLLDEEVEEINILDSGRAVWVHHSELGGCVYNYRVHEAAHHLTSLIKLETGIPLDEERPYIKATVKTRDFRARVSIDISPIAVDGLTISIRKFRVKPFTLAELVARGTLTAKAAAYLLWNLYHRRNISILGESGAGKTTLAIALDSLSPPWRKISIEEDAVENIDQKVLGMEHVRYLTFASRRKERERVLLNILHKSPVYVFLGEVLYPEDSRMLFHMLASGIKCIHTCHAEDVPQLLSKWRNYHGIPAESFLDLDLLVVMKKSGERPVQRRVVKICEVEKRLYEGAVEVVEVFSLNPSTKELEVSIASIERSPSIRREIANGYPLSAILKELALYERVLRDYASLKEHSLEDLRRELLKVRSYALLKEAEAFS